MPQSKEVTECQTESYTEEYDDEKLARIYVEVSWVQEELISYDGPDETGGFERSDSTQEVRSRLLFERTGEKEIELTGFRATRNPRGDELDREHLRVLRTLDYGSDVVRENAGSQLTVVDVCSTVSEQLEK
jgi:hypothetical protein